MTSVSTGHIILTTNQSRQPVGSGRPQPGSNPRPPHQEWFALSIRGEEVLGREEKKGLKRGGGGRAKILCK